MPLASDRSATDRAIGASFQTHPRTNGDHILRPADALERRGDFSVLDAGGVPERFRVGTTGKVVARNYYVGPTPEMTWVQNDTPLGKARPSFALTQPVEETRTPPDANTPDRALLPRPLAPTVEFIEADNAGYAASTPESPHFIAFTRIKNGRHSLLGPATSFRGGQGQAYRVLLLEELLGKDEELGIWMADPGTSRPETPGTMHLQRVLDLQSYYLPYYDLTGPFRRDLRLRPTKDETKISPPRACGLRREIRSMGLRPGPWLVRATWVDEDGGETLAGTISRIDVPLSADYTRRDEEGKITLRAGKGRIHITRPLPAPVNAVGWRAYVWVRGSTDDWARVVDRLEGLGGERPFPLSYRSVGTAGWSGNEEFYGNNDRYILSGGGLPQADSTGVEPLDTAPEAPTAIGISRPGSTPLYARVTDVDEYGAESLPSDAVRFIPGANQIARIIATDPENRVQNGAFIEVGANGLPLGHTVVKTGGDAYVDHDGLVLETLAPQTGATPSETTAYSAVDPTRASSTTTEVVIENPPTGTLSGSAQIVMQEVSATGAVTETVLKTETTPGVVVHHQEIGAASAGTAASAFTLTWRSTTVKFRIVIRMSGTTINIRIRIRRIRFSWWYWWRRRRRRKPVDPNVPFDPITPIDQPDAPFVERDVAIEAPPEPPDSPETYAIESPFRPTTPGTVLETVDFEAGIPASWATVAEGGATVAAAAAAALNGTQGLRVVKATAGSLARGFVHKAFGAAGFPANTSQAAGHAVAHRIPTWPVDGAIGLSGLARPSDGKVWAWPEAASMREVGELVITDEPTKDGTVQVTLDGVGYGIQVVSVKEVTHLDLAAPTASGVTTITTPFEIHRIAPGGTQAQFTLTIDHGPYETGTLTLNPGDGAKSVKVYDPDSASQAAARIQAVGWPGWNVTRNSNKLTFTAVLSGPRPAPSYSKGTSNTPATLKVLASGTLETADEFAARIRGTAFSGYETSGATNRVTFTAVQGGPRTDLTYDPSTTGATGTVTVATQGSVDTKEQLAARIRGTVFTNWTASGTGATVRFTATATGARQNLTYDSKDTGASGTFRTVTQGSNLDVLAVVLDSNGARHQRKILAGLSTTSVVVTDVTCSGAGTARGIVNFWGALGLGTTLQLLARFEDVDLTAYPAGVRQIGVTSESSASLTWDVHADYARVTDRGLTWFRDHNARGEFIHQLRGDFAAGMPLSQDLLIQPGPNGESEFAVIPGGQYAPGFYLYHRGVGPTERAEPILLTAYSPEGDAYDLPSLTGGGVLGDSAGWVHYSLEGANAPTITDNFYRVRIRSRDIQEGLFVIQELAVSPGTVVDRSGSYATSGTYRATHDLSTPNEPSGSLVGRERRDLVSDTEAPVGTSVTVAYSSRFPNEPFSTPTSDPALVPDRPIVECLYTFSGTGYTTPVLFVNSPRIEYVITLKGREEPVMLRADRSEFPGGVFFREIQEWEASEATSVVRLPSGRYSVAPMPFGPVGHLPPSEIVIRDKETKRMLSLLWGREPVWVEYGGEAIQLRLTAKPVWKSELGTHYGLTRRHHGVFTSVLREAQVLVARELPGRSA